MWSLRTKLVWPLLTVLALGVGTADVRADESGKSTGALSWDRTEHDFGSVGQHQELEAVFTYTNRGEATVANIRAQPDCGCYGLTLSDTVLGPGESGTLKVRFRTLTFIGRMVKFARVNYQDGSARRAKLRLSVDINAGVLLQPSRVFFGEIVVGTRPRSEIHLQYREGRSKPFRITKVHLPGSDFEIPKPVPYADPRDPKWRGWTLAFQFAKPPPLGVYSKHAVVETDHPDYPQVRISLTANVVGKVWVQKPRMYMGLVAQGEKRELTTLVRPTKGSGVALGRVSAKARKGVLQARLEPVPGKADHYTLVVALPATAEPGLQDDVIEIHTEVPGEAVTEVQVKVRVFKRR